MAPWKSASFPYDLIVEIPYDVKVENNNYQDPTSAHTTATLILKTYPGPVFRLKLPVHEARTIATAVQEASTFVWDEFDVLALTLPTTSTYPLPYRPVVVSLGEQLKKRGL